MSPRLHSTTPLALGHRALDDAAARHVRVLRLDAGAALTLFDGRGGEWHARVQQTRADTVIVEVLEHMAIERELALEVHLAVVMPANDRMDFLVEKATELGAASIQPLVSARSVLRIAGERAVKKRAHWQAVACAACEQCGRNRLPEIGVPMGLDRWLAHLGPATPMVARWLLSPPVGAGASAVLGLATGRIVSALADAKVATLISLSGPEGGLSPDEERECAETHGFVARSLGPRVLRAETAPLVVLAALA